MSSVQRAVDDLAYMFASRQYWLSLAWHDIKLRYRGSLIGPFWLTLSTGLLIAGLGIFYSQLLNQDPANYIPYLAIGILVWNFITGTLLECCNAFIGAAATIKQIKLPLTGYLLQIIWRNLLILAHHFVILFMVAFYFALQVTWLWSWALLGFLLMMANMAWAGLLLATLCARFRDLPQIVGSIFQLAFFLSPVLWERGMLKGHFWVVDWNPLYAWIEIVRAPLLARPVEAGMWFLALATLALGWLTAAFVFARYRARIVYWI